MQGHMIAYTKDWSIKHCQAHEGVDWWVTKFLAFQVVTVTWRWAPGARSCTRTRASPAAAQWPGRSPSSSPAPRATWWTWSCPTPAAPPTLCLTLTHALESELNYQSFWFEQRFLCCSIWCHTLIIYPFNCFLLNSA